jgi:hypothetical protein
MSGDFAFVGELEATGFAFDNYEMSSRRHDPKDTQSELPPPQNLEISNSATSCTLAERSTARLM